MNIQTNIPTDPHTMTEPVTNLTESRVFVPAADIHETPTAILIRCDIPGVAENDIEIVLENRVLTISGTQKDMHREGFESLVQEYPLGTYQRAFNLNRDLEGAAVKARLDHGVLEIEVPKAKPVEARRIQLGN